MPYSMESLKDNCYDGTTCLVNKLNIRDEKVLQQVESSITLVKFSYLMSNPLPGSYDFEYYREIHRYLFGDLYDWAGEIRTINLSKKGTSFMKAEQIEASANACFERINSLDFSKMSHDELIEEFADFYNTLNLIHPFREGHSMDATLGIRCQFIGNRQGCFNVCHHLCSTRDYGRAERDIFHTHSRPTQIRCATDILIASIFFPGLC